jgi:hypothetical protein
MWMDRHNYGGISCENIMEVVEKDAAFAADGDDMSIDMRVIQSTNPKLVFIYTNSFFLHLVEYHGVSSSDFTKGMQPIHWGAYLHHT